MMHGQKNIKLRDVSFNICNFKLWFKVVKPEQNANKICYILNKRINNTAGWKKFKFLAI